MTPEDRLAELLVEYEDAIADGVPRTPEQVCQDCPELAPTFRSLLTRLGRLRVVMDGDGTETDAVPTGAGRFRPLSFHAKGGLGAVYVAEDTELPRPVALKTMQMIPARDPAARRRFLLEAEVTGKLDHPGVVPVYGVGRDASGRPYYAMRFVRGSTLGDAFAKLHARPAGDPEWPVEFRRLLTHFVAVCQTIAHAHERGVVHRDLKPANILLGKFGETLVVDWGLAKIVSRAGDAETVDDGVSPITSAHDGESVAGNVKGSPAYMSPEQARGGNTDPATDVYGLGALLFALLAGRAPYTGTTDGVIDRVRSATAPPSAREVRPTVPKALDAICRKAMASRPEDRYPSAQAVAADVERFLADQPVTAYRDPFAERARRWVRRHRTLVAAAAVGLVVGSALLAAAGVVLTGKNQQLGSANRQLGSANQELASTNQELRKAVNDRDVAIGQRDERYRELQDRNTELAASHTSTRADFDRADEAIGGTVASISQRLTGGRAAPDPIRTAVYTTARGYYREFIARNGGRPGLALAVAFAHVKQAEAEVGLRNDAAAPPLLDEARRRFGQILAERPGDPEATYGLAQADLAAAHLLIWELKIAEARRPLLAACDSFRRLCDLPEPRPTRFAGMAAPEYQLALAVVAARELAFRSDPRKTSTQVPGVAPAPQQAKEIDFVNRARAAEALLRAKLARDGDPTSEARAMLAVLQIALGEELFAGDPAGEGLKLLRAGREALEAVIDHFPAAYDLELQIQIIYFYEALALRERKEFAEAERVMTRARDKCRSLGERPWGVDEYGIRDRAWMFAGLASKTLGEWAAKGNTPKDVVRHFRAAVEAFKRVSPQPARSELSVRMPLMQAYVEITYTLSGIPEADPELVRAAFEQGRTELATLAPLLGEVPWYRRERAYFDCLYAMLLADQKDPRNPFPLADAAVKSLEKYTREQPDDELGRFQHGVALMARGMIHGVLGERYEEALVDARAAVGKLENPPTGITRENAGNARRMVRKIIAIATAIRAEEILMSPLPDRARARAYADEGLKALKEIEDEFKDLDQVERQFRQLLTGFRLKAGPK